mmetsp:Transcript_113027/g.330327  ORF Transcript_113027/g.330327 Transcript_113027/m.330327 type:complete len:238 (-) Transcript_113027:365-1078(-)
MILVHGVATLRPVVCHFSHQVQLASGSMMESKLDDNKRRTKAWQFREHRQDLSIVALAVQEDEVHTHGLHAELLQQRGRRVALHGHGDDPALDLRIVGRQGRIPASLHAVPPVRVQEHVLPSQTREHVDCFHDLRMWREAVLEPPKGQVLSHAGADGRVDHPRALGAQAHAQRVGGELRDDGLQGLHEDHLRVAAGRRVHEAEERDLSLVELVWANLKEPQPRLDAGGIQARQVTLV